MLRNTSHINLTNNLYYLVGQYSSNIILKKLYNLYVVNNLSNCGKELLKVNNTTHSWKQTMTPTPVMEVVGIVKTYLPGSNRRSEVP